MTDARRIDLNYGHFGEPIYDLVNQEWRFPRQTNDALRLRRLGESRILVAAQPTDIDRRLIQNATQRGKSIKQLIQAYPEAAPAAALLSPGAENVDRPQNTTSPYDPSISGLLAFGSALHPRHHRDDPKCVSVVAFAGGPGRELARFIQLVPESVGWGGANAITLKDEVLQPRIQGIWSSSGSPIQQLRFAETDREPKEWLAVRCAGGTTILRLVLRESEVPMTCQIPQPLAIGQEVEFRIEVEHIVKLDMQRSGGIPHADRITLNKQRAQRIRLPKYDVDPLVRGPDEEDLNVQSAKIQWTINLEWLAKSIESSPRTSFEEALGLIVNRFSNRCDRTIPGIASLEELINQDVAVSDIEEESTALKQYLHSGEHGTFFSHDDFAALAEKSISMSRLTVDSLPSFLHAQPDNSLSQTYDTLIASWVSSLAKRIPSQIRTRTERTIRCIAIDLQFASYGLKLQFEEHRPEEESRKITNEWQTSFTLPVRSFPDYPHKSRQVKAKAIQQASTGRVFSPSSEPGDFMPPANLPTPEPTPSVHSQGTDVSKDQNHDPASARLRALTNVANQTPLPHGIMGILSHWSIGQNPDDYNWEVSKALFEQGHKPDDDEEKSRTRKRRRQERPPKEREDTAVASSSQALPPRLSMSQTERPVDPQYSSQPTVGIGSQPQPGRYGARKPAKKDQKGKKHGF
ncbi:MAG: hypothetical protein Q9219_001962 [cf. Caloplaca sp. 3 TL-2023]